MDEMGDCEDGGAFLRGERGRFSCLCGRGGFGDCEGTTGLWVG